MRWNSLSTAKTLPEPGTVFESTVIEEHGGSIFDCLSQAATEVGAASREPIGHVGRYLLQTVLGQGGLGTVYGAWDPLLSRRVAVKTLQVRWHQAGSALASPNELILNEARASARLSHPNIVTVFDAGNSEQGIYIAMEPLQGMDLRKLQRTGWRPDWIEIAQLVRKVADALAYAHGKGVIHCDIKPANIFMVDKRVPKVLDFGIARVSRREGASTVVASAGSPHYLSPEQLLASDIDRRCDVYSLGVVMFELLTGQPPYTGSTVDEIGRATLNEPQPQASEVDARVPAGLSAIAAQAMARAPEARYPSARHLANALQQWLHSGEGVELQLSPKERQGQARQKLLLMISAVALAIAAAALWRDQLALQAQRARPPVAVSVAAHQAAPTSPGPAA